MSWACFRKGTAASKLAHANVDFAEIVVGVKVARIEDYGFFQLFFRVGKFSGADQAGRQVRSGGGVIRLDADRGLELLRGLRVVRFGGINESEEFVDFEDLWGFAQSFSSCAAASGRCPASYCATADWKSRSRRWVSLSCATVSTLASIAKDIHPHGQRRRITVGMLTPA